MAAAWKAVMDHPVFAMMHYKKDNTIAVHSVIQYMIFLMLYIYVDYYSVYHTLGLGWGGRGNCVIKVLCGERKIPDQGANYHVQLLGGRAAVGSHYSSQSQPITNTLAGS